MATRDDFLTNRVFLLNDNAVQNGYIDDFDGSGRTIYDVDPRRLAEDLERCDADLEGEDIDVLTELCRAWQTARRPS